MEYNWNIFGHCMGFKMKVLKHIEAHNCDRVKDYLTKAYDNVDPTIIEAHPCFDIIQEGMKFLKENGWKVGRYDWGG